MANSSITKTEAALFRRAKQAGVNTDIDHRWGQGIAHHPQAEQLGREIGAADWLFGDDCFGLKFGGDGDNGEHLLYLLDILFELRDAETAPAPVTE